MCYVVLLRTTKLIFLQRHLAVQILCLNLQNLVCMIYPLHLTQMYRITRMPKNSKLEGVLKYVEFTLLYSCLFLFLALPFIFLIVHCSAPQFISFI